MEYEGLIDPKILQRLQDYFCQANGIYLACVGRQLGVLTKAYGSRAEREFVHSMVDKDTYMSLLKKLQNSSVENVIEEPVDFNFIRMAGITTRLEDGSQLSWVAIGVIKENIPEGFELPEGIMSTSEEKFYHAIEFLEVVTTNFIQAKVEEKKAQDDMQEKSDLEAKTESELKKNAAMTEIIRLLGSDEGFSSIVQSALKQVCSTLDISYGYLVREKTDSEYEILCEYRTQRDGGYVPIYKTVAGEDVPFFTGKPYMISYDTIKPENFRKLFEKNMIKAAIYQPIIVHGRNEMYLCFCEHEKDRVWTVSDISFINEVKSVIQSVLNKRIDKNSLASSFASLEDILENVGCGIYVADSINRKILYSNRYFKNAFGEAVSQGKLDDVIFAHMEINKESSYEECYLAENNMWADIHRGSISWVDGRTVMLCTIYDTTDKKLYQQEIEKSAKLDYLTGLPNRRSCEQDLDRCIRMAEISGKQGALIYIDLDDFKSVNDNIGHRYGDAVLKSAAHYLRKIEEITDSIYRVGGDEFIAIVKEITETDLKRICDEIKKVFELKNCSISIGTALYPGDGNKVSDIIGRADRALFAAKKKGRNCVVNYSELNDNKSSENDMESVMKSAVKDDIDQFEVYYQPIVNNKKPNCPCEGAEALVRWNSPELGLLLPDQFMQTAEYLGVLNTIGGHVLAHAIKRCKYWNDMGHPEYRVHINLSDSQIMSQNTAEDIKEILETSRINPANVHLEIAEHQGLQDRDQFITALAKLKELGVSLELDNFGQASSSVNSIKDFSVDGVKIDRAVIKSMDTDDFAGAMLKAVIDMCKVLDVRTYAVGVEDEAQHGVVTEAGADFVQGYYFGLPVSEQEFEEKFL